MVITGTRVAACVEAERLTWWSVWRSAAQRLTTLCIEPRSVVLVKLDVREVQHLAHEEPGCREWAAHESALVAQDPPSVIVHPLLSVFPGA